MARDTGPAMFMTTSLPAPNSDSSVTNVWRLGSNWWEGRSRQESGVAGSGSSLRRRQQVVRLRVWQLPCQCIVHFGTQGVVNQR